MKLLLLFINRFINRVAAHPDLQTDPSFVDFLEVEGDLPRATSTSALSSAGVMRLFSRVGDSIGKITFKIDETDEVRLPAFYRVWHNKVASGVFANFAEITWNFIVKF